ncbi:MAG: hypothetical protein ACJ762_08560 [Solirubrobacteraceae bacterium]
MRVSDLRGTGGAAYGAVLADPSGRRASRLRWTGRLVGLVFLLWLFGLVLAGLGLLPLSDLPLAGALRGAAEPPSLTSLPDPKPTSKADLRPAVPAVQVAPTSATATGSPTTPAPAADPAPRARRPATRPARPGRGNATVTTTPAPAPGASGSAPGQTKTKTTPAQSQTAPGQTKTTPGPSPTAPGQTKTTPSSGAGNADSAPGHDPTRKTGHGPPSG